MPGWPTCPGTKAKIEGREETGEGGFNQAAERSALDEILKSKVLLYLVLQQSRRLKWKVEGNIIVSFVIFRLGVDVCGLSLCGS